MSLAAIRDSALLIAKGEVGTHEVGGNNLGPRVQQYLAAARLPGGQPWCVAFVIWCYRQASAMRGEPSPLPQIGHVGRFYRFIADHHPEWISDVPTIGAIACHSLNPTDPVNSHGHVGLITLIEPHILTDLSGNTSSTGSREGSVVGLNDRPRSYWSLGFIDVGRFGPAPAPAVG